LRSVQAVTGGNALIAHVAFVDGQIVGGWRRADGRDATLVTLDLLAPLREEERRRVAAAARRLGVFLDAPVEVRGLA
jgi:hypothetical protein